MSQLNNYPQKFLETFIRHTNMINNIGLDVLDYSVTLNIKKFRRFFLIMTFLCFMLICQILYIVKSNEIDAHFSQIVCAIPSTLISVQDSIIGLVLFLNRNKVANVIKKIGEVWPEHVEGDKLESLNYWTWHTNLIHTVFVRAGIVSLIFFELEPLAITLYGIYKDNIVHYEFPLQMYVFFTVKSPYAFTFIYLYQCGVITLAHMSLYIPCALLLVDLTCDLSALLALLKIDLEKLVQESRPDFDFGENDNCDDIKDLVVLHQKLLSIAADLNNIFGYIIITHVSFSSVIICCYGFMAMIANGVLLKFITATLGILFGIFIISWPGQRLADTSLDIADAAYECHWFERGKKFRQYIALIIVRSQSPCYISALGFTDVTLRMFTKIMSSSWSYLSLLNQMYEDFDV